MLLKYINNNCLKTTDITVYKTLGNSYIKQSLNSSVKTIVQFYQNIIS